MRIVVKNVNRVRAKGRIYFYHRVTGERLPDAPEAAARRAIEINAGLGSSSPPETGTVRDAIVQYKSSPEFRGLAASTRHQYAYYLDWIGERAGAESLATITKATILALRDGLSATPRRANHVVQAFRRLLNFAAEREMIPASPAVRIQMLKGGAGHKPWPDPAIERFRATAPRELVWALELGLYTGQRKGDVIRMAWTHLRDGGIDVTQAKTGERLWVPLHPRLRQTLADVERRGVTILTTVTGRAWTPHHFDHAFRAAVDACGLSGLVFHGLRHTAGKMLAEAGCTDRQLMAVLGHRTAAMVTRYTRGAEQQRLAREAIGKLGFAKPGDRDCKTAFGRTNGNAS